MESERAVALWCVVVALLMVLAAVIGALAGHFQPRDTWVDAPTAAPALVETDGGSR